MKDLTLISGLTEIEFNDVGNAQGFEYPELSNVTVSVPGRSGQFYLNSDYEARRLSWEGLANGVTERREISSFQIGSLKTLKFSTCDDIALQTDVEILKFIMPSKLGRSKYLFEALAPDYRFVAQVASIATTQVTIVTGGTALPTALPISFGSVTGTPALTVNNAGNAYASTVFTIKGPGTNFIVQNQTTGQSFNVNIALLSNETVVVDTENRTVVKGSTNQYGLFSGDFWELAPGNNEIFFNADSGTDANTLLTIDYRSSYLGI